MDSIKPKIKKILAPLLAPLDHRLDALHREIDDLKSQVAHLQTQQRGSNEISEQVELMENLAESRATAERETLRRIVEIERRVSANEA